MGWEECSSKHPRRANNSIKDGRQDVSLKSGEKWLMSLPVAFLVLDHSSKKVPGILSFFLVYFPKKNTFNSAWLILYSHKYATFHFIWLVMIYNFCSSQNKVSQKVSLDICSHILNSLVYYRASSALVFKQKNLSFVSSKRGTLLM